MIIGIIKNKKLKRTSYQFLKYHNFESWTDKNVYPMNYGTSYRTPGTHFIKYYRDLGYITGRASNFCSVELFPVYKWNIYELKGLKFDHEHFGLFCDPNFIEPKAPFSSIKGPYSFRRKCSYGTDSFNHVFNYGLEFLKAYEDQPKVLHISFNDLYSSIKYFSYLNNHIKLCYKIMNFLLFQIQSLLNEKYVILIFMNLY